MELFTSFNIFIQQIISFIYPLLFFLSNTFMLFITFISQLLHPYFFAFFAFLLHFLVRLFAFVLHFCVFFSRFLFRVCCERPCWAVPRCSLPFLYHYCDLPVLIATKKWRYFTKFRASPLGRTSMFFILFTFAHKKRFFFNLIFLCDPKKNFPKENCDLFCISCDPEMSQLVAV